MLMASNYVGHVCSLCSFLKCVYMNKLCIFDIEKWAEALKCVKIAVIYSYPCTITRNFSQICSVFNYKSKRKCVGRPRPPTKKAPLRILFI